MKYLTITLLAITAVTFTTQAQRIGGRAQKPNNDAARTKPTGSNLSPTQQQNIQKLQADLQAIKQGSQVTTEQKQALKNDLMAMADGATKPDPALVQQLANDLSEAIADGSIDSKEKAQLANDLQKVMNSAGIPPEEVNQAIADAQAILASSGVDKSAVQTIVNDLKAIATEAKNNAPNGGAKAAGFKGKFKRNN
ncbi:MAG: hypothetical protein JNM09_09805 [Blastocatellia bacterium]|nr:hypothetical protein [Blastocatellia bacterium]